MLVVVVVVFALSVALTTRSGKKEYSLLHQPAPAISGQLFNGGTFDLANHLGKDLVVLHFFTSLGPSSAKALPVAASATADWKDKGVVYFAINEKQSRSEVKEFLDKIQVTVPVVMDPDGNIAETFKVENFPTAVLIGRDGKIDSIEQGFGDNLNDNLKSKLTKMHMLPQSNNGDG